MLHINKLPLVLIGACEAAAQLLFMVSAGHLPGVMLPVIGQTYLVWNLMFATLLLKARCGDRGRERHPPGVMLPVIVQTCLVWNLAFATFQATGGGYQRG